MQARAGETFLKLVPNFSQISRAHGKFGEQNKALESSLLIINYHIFINKYYNYIINA